MSSHTASNLLLDKEWSNLPHVHTGLPVIDHPINCSLQILFHIPDFIRLLRQLEHKCLSPDDWVCCHVLKIWGAVQLGNVQRELIGDFCQELPKYTTVFETIIGIVSSLHGTFVPDRNLEVSPVIDVFGGRLRMEYKCVDCGMERMTNELLMCLQLTQHTSDNIQQLIDEALQTRTVACSQCSGEHCTVRKEMTQTPKVLFIHLVRLPEYSTGKPFNLSLNINLHNLVHYKIIGSVQDDRGAIVRCPDNSLVSIANRRVKSVSLDRLSGSEIGESCSLVVYKMENYIVQTKSREVATPIKLARQSTPIHASSDPFTESVRSTTKWSVSRIDCPSSQREGTLKPRKLYGNSDSTNADSEGMSSTRKSRSGRMIKYIYVRTIASYRTCVKDPIMFKYFCGLSPYNFEVLYKLLGGDEQIVRLKLKYTQKTPQKIRTERKLSSRDKLFMFLIRLRRGPPLLDLAYCFGIEKTYCGEVVYAMLRFLYLKFKGLEKYMFISAEAQKYKKPLPFRPFKNLRVIIDGLEIFVDSPSNFQHQGNTYSDYKAHNTVRFIIGISCYGGLMFVSPGFEGNMSEKQALKESGFYEYLQAGDVVMSDRGFDIDDDLLRRGVDLVKPPSLDGRERFTPEEEISTRAIAAARIYVEHAVKLIKVNRLLKPCVPLTLLPTLSDYVYVAGALANFGAKNFKQGDKKKKGGQKKVVHKKNKVVQKKKKAVQQKKDS